MPEKYTYLLVDLLCIIFPFAFSFHPKINFHKQWKYFIIPCFLAAIIFIVWDIIFTKIDVWKFNHNYVCGAFLFDLPLEEYLFFICIPYACTFTFYCINLFLRPAGYNLLAKGFSIVLILFLIVMASTHISRLYTSVTFLLLAIFLIFLLLQRASFLPLFYISFLIILIPFFISNGILTGSCIAEPVVIYNNKYNLGVRMFTIPFEDIFYGMLLLLMNISGFEYLKHKTILRF